MYYPYIRGRQYELIALKEFAINKTLSRHVVPIIEPVKFSPTLLKTLDAFTSNKLKLILISNPQVGSFLSDLKQADRDHINRYNLLIDNPVIENAYIINSKSPDDTQNLSKCSYVIHNIESLTERYKVIFENNSPANTLIPDTGVFRRALRGVKTKRILLSDNFNKLDRNSDYLNTGTEFFSEDHLYYKDEGYKGFCDYSILGSDYQEGGFAPFAIAIHIVYFDKENRLHIKHFVSQSNTDIKNPNIKFHEALHKLITWMESEEGGYNITSSLETLKNIYDEGSYPGLGTVKKLALKHHLELMGKFLDSQ